MKHVFEPLGHQKLSNFSTLAPNKYFLEQDIKNLPLSRIHHAMVVKNVKFQPPSSKTVGGVAFQTIENIV